MANNQKYEIHQRIIYQIHRLMRGYNALEPEVKKEILRFLSTADAVTKLNLNVKPKNFTKQADKAFNSTSLSKHYLII